MCFKVSTRGSLISTLKLPIKPPERQLRPWQLEFLMSINFCVCTVCKQQSALAYRMQRDQSLRIYLMFTGCCASDREMWEKTKEFNVIRGTSVIWDMSNQKWWCTVLLDSVQELIRIDISSIFKLMEKQKISSQYLVINVHI